MAYYAAAQHMWNRQYSDESWAMVFSPLRALTLTTYQF